MVTFYYLFSLKFRIFTAPFQHVGFADFWLADQLNSLAVALLDFQFIICFYAHDWHVTNCECSCYIIYFYIIYFSWNVHSFSKINLMSVLFSMSPKAGPVILKGNDESYFYN